MHREGLPGGGLRLSVTTPALPPLRVEVAGPDRFWVRQEERPVLLAEVARGNSGVHYRRIAGYAPVLPPITAASARTMPSWPHRYASWLTAGPGPLHTGWWSLRPWRPPPFLWTHEVAVDAAGLLDWSDGWQGLVPMRPLPAADNGRVRAYRKLAREGTLPPLLVWWVSGLDGMLLLDGHSRLAAALAEGLTPPALGLSLAPSPAQIDEQIAHVTRHDSVVMAQLKREGRADVDSATRAQQWHFGTVYADIPGERERTRAWPLPGGAAAWQQVAASSPDRTTDSGSGRPFLPRRG